jgi:alkylated DNA repair dioxygenase AlkB
MAWAKPTMLEAGGFLRYDAAFLSAADAAVAARALVDSLAWEQRTILLFGREIVQPRLIAWAGSLPYRYSGQTLEPRAAPAVLERLWRRVDEVTDHQFNHVLVNRYRDGSDSMGWHSDDEPELGPDPPVASLSLGETRRFVLQARRGRSRARSLDLTSGSLLFRGGPCQHRYRHAVPKQRSIQGERINLTFRRILRVPG